MIWARFSTEERAHVALSFQPGGCLEWRVERRDDLPDYPWALCVYPCSAIPFLPEEEAA